MARHFSLSLALLITFGVSQAGLSYDGSPKPSGSASGDEPLSVGQRHGDFTLPLIGDGRPLSLSDFRGRKVLLIQFASW